eukprot:4127249-Prymnesium_polylepis.1
MGHRAFLRDSPTYSQRSQVSAQLRVAIAAVAAVVGCASCGVLIGSGWRRRVPRRRDATGLHAARRAVGDAPTSRRTAHRS